MSLRNLLGASALYTLGNIAPKVGAFLLLPVYLRLLTQADYGALALLSSLAGILAVLYHLGLDSALMRLHFDVEGRARARLYSTATMFSVGLGVALTALLAVAFTPSFEALFAGMPFVPLGLLALLVALVGSLQYVPSTLFRASGQPSRFLVVNLGAFLLSSASSVTLVVAFGLGAAGVLTGQFVGGLAVLVVTIMVVRRLGPWSFSWEQLRGALQLGLPLVPHSISSWAMRFADRWLIALLIGLPAIEARSQVGVYAVGYQLGLIVSIAITSFNAAWSPYFFRIGNRSSGPHLYAEMVTLVTAGLLTLATVISALGPEIVAVIARPGYEAASDVLPIIAFASVFQGLYVMFVTVVFLTKRTRRLAMLSFTSAALNIALNVLLIPPLGIFGAAWATIGAYAFLAVATYAFSRRMYPMRIAWVRLASMATVAIAGVAGARLLALEPSVVSAIAHAALALLAAATIGALAWSPLRRLRALSRRVPAEA